MSFSDSQKRDSFLKTCLVKDLRTECRNRGINPAGGRDTLVDKLNDSMTQRGETSFGIAGGPASAELMFAHGSVNNYSRPEGQNVGNFVTDRSSSRVLAPPGGKSSVNFFRPAAESDTAKETTPPPPISPPPAQPTRTSPQVAEKPTPVIVASPPPSKPEQQPVEREGLSLANNDYPTTAPPVGERGNNNNYARPGDRQNVGNYITGRSTSRVLAPPGGGSSITFG